MPPKKASAAKAKAPAAKTAAAKKSALQKAAAAVPAPKVNGTKRKRSEAESDDEQEDEKLPVKKPAPKTGTLKKEAGSVAASKSNKAMSKPTAKETVASKKAGSEVSVKPVTKKAASRVAAERSGAAKRKSESESEDEPEPKKMKTTKAAVPKKAAAPRKAAAKPAGKKVTKKPAISKKVVAQEHGESETESEDDARSAKKPAAKKAAAPRKAATPKAPRVPKAKPAKVLPVINVAPTTILDIFVFGEGSAGELGLGATKGPDGKKVVDVTRPRLNPRLSAKDVGVVQFAVGGMHVAALTHDNKILTWGVNDQGALGRETPADGKMKEIVEGGGDDSDSESDDDSDSGLNPNEAEPREVDPAHFPDGTQFASVYAGDSTTFALTTTGLVYGWGTFRGNDGVLGFRIGIKTQTTPILINELKNVTNLAVGTNHVLALTSKGKVYTWGAGEQSQLARRVVSRTAEGALIPREFGLQRKKVVTIGAGDYHSFAVDGKGDTYSWGLNTFGQTGVEKKDDDDNTVATPTLVPNLKPYEIKQIVGGAHHSLACTEAGEVLIWGRSDTAQSGMDVSKLPEGDVFKDENGRPRFLSKPTAIPGINGAFVAIGSDTSIAVDKAGKAYSWGFSSNYQTGQGSDADVTVATLIENSAIKEKKLVFAGVGGQFGIVAGIADV